jgi:Protein of unknown function (DUF3352)
MQKHTTSQRLVSLIAAVVLVASPLLAQRRNVAPRKTPAAEVGQPAPTFDTLLAADSFKVYCEVRSVGALIHSPAVNDLLDPLMKVVGPAPEFDNALKWLKAHAESLAGSRMLVAGWPSRPKLPNFLVAIEFSSAEDAKRFYPQLRGFIPTLLPTPTPTPAPLPPATVLRTTTSDTTTATNDGQVAGASIPLVTPAGAEHPGTVAAAESAPAPPPYQIQQSGTLLLISDTAFTFRNLRPRSSKPLEDDLNFTMARNRFASESLFLYVDLKSLEKEEREQRKKWEEEEQKRAESEAANPPRAELDQGEVNPGAAEQPTPYPEPETFSSPVPIEPSVAAQEISGGTPAAETTREIDIASPLISAFSRALFGGESKWPEAISAALVFEDDAYVLRTLIINSEENKTIALPFMPQLLSGPPLVPESPDIFPADTEFFVSASLDYPQMYEGMLKAIASAEELPKRFQNRSREVPPPSPFATYEAKLGIKIKEDVLPLLGNEVAVALPRKAPAPAATPEDANKSNPVDTIQKNPRSAEPNPVIAIAIKDREAVARLLPRIIESFGLKGASLLAQTEKRDGTEITSYGGLFAYAFIGDFLVLSPDAALTRHVVDSYLTHQTLAADSHFRNFTRWQPRQVLGQVYVAPGLVERYSSLMLTGGPPAETSSEASSRFNQLVDPLTYSLTNDGQGPLHELRVPKNLLQLIIGTTARASEQGHRQSNEGMARSALQSLAGAESAFLANKGAGRYGTLEELSEAGFISLDWLQNSGYTIQVSASGNRFEASAIPTEYGKTGRLSFFIDESRVLRAGDHGGGAATIADQPE